MPSDVVLEGDLAVDTETKGLSIYERDRLCVVQISNGDGNAHVIKIEKDEYASAKNLIALLADESRCKIFHYARFDVGAIRKYLGVEIHNVYCTKIASKLTRTYTDRHGLKDLCKELINVDLSKQQQCSNWAAEKLTKDQINYAASDVLYLHQIRDILNERLKEEGREEIAQKCFEFIHTRSILDENGWEEVDIFSHA